MNARHFTSFGFVAALCALGCGYNVNTIPSSEDCIAQGAGNCGGGGGTSGSGHSGSGGAAGNAGSGGMGGTGGTGGTGGNGSCAVLEFECDNSSCIPMGAFCDGDDDCGDSSDEPVGCGIAGTGGIGGVAGVVGGIGGVAGVVGGIGGIGGSAGSGNACEPCDPIGTSPFVSLESCCYDQATCGARIQGAALCADVFDEGLPDDSCPSANIMGIQTPGCCRTDGRCGMVGTFLNLGCVANSDVPPVFGGPLPEQTCGNVINRPCRSNRECPADHICSAIDFNSGLAYCTPRRLSGFPGGSECFGDDQCASNFCLPFSNECSSACTASDECENNYRGPICASFTAGSSGVPLNLCGTSCTTTRDCLWGDQACSLAQDAQLQEPTGMCAATKVVGFELSDPGVPCIDNAECSSGVCLANFGGNSYCSALCTGSGQGTCPSVLPLCVPFEDVFGVPAPVMICSPGG